VVNIIGFNPNLAKVGELALLITHTKMYKRVQILQRTKDGMGG